MPKSRVRRKADYTPPPTRSPKKRSSAPWVAPTMVALFLLGIVWLTVFYVSGGDLPIRALSNWNLLIGFGAIVGGFALATQWR